MAGFIGTPTMNFIPATVTNSSAKASGFEVKLPQPVPAEKGMIGFRRCDRARSDSLRD